MPKPAEDATAPTRSDRRRAETRARLLTAARELFAEQGVGATRTGEITERADVAAGSFYNHFEDKNAIVEALLADLAEEQGALVDELTAEIDDPAAVVAFAHRHFVRLAAADPGFGQLAIRLDASHRLMHEALGPRATRDIQAGIDAGRFDISDAAAAVYITGGALLGTISGVVDGLAESRSRPDLAPPGEKIRPSSSSNADELHAEAVLRMLGLSKAQAAKVARLPM